MRVNVKIKRFKKQTWVHVPAWVGVRIFVGKIINKFLN